MKKGVVYVLNEQARKDIMWWYEFLLGFSGTCILWLIDEAPMDTEIAVDACVVGAGGVSEGEFYRVKFPEELKTENLKITHLELWAVILAVRIWGLKYKGKIVKVRSDNEAVSVIVNTGRSRDLYLQRQLCELCWWMAKYQMKIKTVYLPEVLNRLPDLLSRWHEGPHIKQQFLERTGGEMTRREVDRQWFLFTHQW